MRITAKVLMTRSASRTDSGSSRIGEAKYLRRIAVPVDMGPSGTVTGFTALLLELGFRKQFLVGGLQHAGEKLIVTRLAGLSPNVARSLLLCGKAGSRAQQDGK
jgi:hypothetical protein